MVDTMPPKPITFKQVFASVPLKSVKDQLGATTGAQMREQKPKATKLATKIAGANKEKLRRRSPNSMRF